MDWNDGWTWSMVGGAMIGGSAVLMMRLTGRIAGISGIAGRLIVGPDRGWRGLYLIALMLGAGLALALQPISVWRTSYPVPLLVAAGLLVGIGTRVGSGCTSGHGICGIARLSPRSIVATILFVATGMIVATGLRPVLVEWLS